MGRGGRHAGIMYPVLWEAFINVPGRLAGSWALAAVGLVSWALVAVGLVSCALAAVGLGLLRL